MGAGAGDVAIEHCGRTVAGDWVAFDIEWSGSLPEDAVVCWAARITSEDGQDGVELAHERRTAGAVQSVTDRRSGRRQEVDPDADLGDGEITVRFPADVVGVAVEWPSWQAVLSVDGEDVSHRAIPV